MCNYVVTAFPDSALSRPPSFDQSQPPILGRSVENLCEDERTTWQNGELLTLHGFSLFNANRRRLAVYELYEMKYKKTVSNLI